MTSTFRHGGRHQTVRVSTSSIEMILRDETSRQSIAAVIRDSGEGDARGAMIESVLAAR